MKNKIYLFSALSTILLITLFGLAKNRIKDIRYVIFLGNKMQKEEINIPLVKEEFDFSKLGNKKTYKIYPKYFGWYTVCVDITDDILKDTQEIRKNYLYFADCIKIKISVEDKIVYEKIFKEEDALGVYTSLTNMGITLAYFEIKKEYLEKEVTLEFEVVNTNENLIKYINKKTLFVEAGGNL